MNCLTAQRRALGRYCNDLRLAILASSVDLSFKLCSEGLITAEVRDEKKAESIVSAIENRMGVDESSWDILIQVLKDCDFQPLAENLAKQLRVELGGKVALGGNDLVREETAQLRQETKECFQHPSENMMLLVKKIMNHLDQHDQQVTELRASLEAVTKKHDEDKAKLAAVEKICQEDQIKIAIMEAKLAAVEKTHREDHEKHTRQIIEQQRENALLQDEKGKLVKKVDELEGKLVKNMDELEGQLHQHNAQLLSLVPAIGPAWLNDARGTLSSLYPPCQIIMPQFSQHKKDDDIWYTQPFYSAPGGYKLCLRVDANGYGYGAGTHVSVFVCLMKGENDEKLEWPFVHNVTHGILNWKRDENHKMFTAMFKNAHENGNGRVILTEMAQSPLGCSQLLPHSSLCSDASRNIQYLNEDYLCLQVRKVESTQ